MHHYIHFFSEALKAPSTELSPDIVMAAVFLPPINQETSKLEQ